MGSGGGGGVKKMPHIVISGIDLGNKNQFVLLNDKFRTPILPLNK